MYIPKSLILGLFLVAVGLAGGWMLRASASDVASGSSPAPAVMQDATIASGPPVPAGPSVATRPAQATVTSIAAPPGDAGGAAPVTTGAPQGTATSISLPLGASGGALSGDSSTVNTVTHIGQTATGDLVGTSQAITPGIPAVPAVPTGPTGPLPSPTAARYAPVAAAAPAYPPPVTGPGIAVGSPLPTPAPSSAPPAPVAASAPSSASSLPPLPTPPAAPSSSASPAPPPGPTSPSPITVTNDAGPRSATGQGLALEIPPFFGEKLFTPLPDTKSRGISFSEWESYRTDVAGRNILVTTDDSNFFRDRNGKLNGNTGDTDASGLNVTDATDSVIRGSESAGSAPYEALTQGAVDIAKTQPVRPPSSNPPVTGPVPAASSRLVPSGDTNTGDLPKPGVTPTTSLTGTTAASGTPERSFVKQAAKAAALQASTAAANRAAATTGTPVASASVLSAKAAAPKAAAAPAETNASGGSSGANTGYDFPYVTWAQQIGSGVSTAVHTDEGTTLASGQEAVVVGGDGYDDDDNRATGENIIITRDDDNVVIGGTGDVNAQIGDSEQGSVIMGVTRTFIQGGGAY